jgi:hypothetical protein
MEVQKASWNSSGAWSSALPAWDGPSTLVLVFGASWIADVPGPIAELAAAFPMSIMVGCSTAGEIIGDTISEGPVTVAVAKFDTTRLAVEHQRVTDPAQSYDAGLSVTKRLVEREPELRSVFVLSDGLGVNGSALAAGLRDGIDSEDVVITGGLAGDGELFQHTWTVVGGAPRPGFVSAVGLAGSSVGVGQGSRCGWDAFGPERRVTRSEGNVLYELDGQPALRLYENYLGTLAAGLPATGLLFPLAVRPAGDRGGEFVRTIVSVDDRTESMTFAGDMPEGACARLMFGDSDRLVAGAHRAARDAGTDTRGSSLAIATACVGRRMVLGPHGEDEIEAVRAGLPAGSKLVGFYSYGELSSSAAGGCDFHNQSMTVTTVWENPDNG